MSRTKTKTMAERILNAATKETTINTTVLRKRLRLYATEVNSSAFHNTVMRTTRLLAENGLLKRTEPGTYTLTKKGLKVANA